MIGLIFRLNLLITFLLLSLMQLPMSLNAAQISLKIVPADKVQWSALNPARGANSPQAGQLWGDRQTPGATGFLVKFKDGFSSPPHIHNVGYRGVVIKGNIHNDDPGAEEFWMRPGSFWTQPAGANHVTSAKGELNIAYIQIDSGPYLVKPSEQAFEDGVKPVNIDVSNLVWQKLNSSRKATSDKSVGSTYTPEITYLWGKPNGTELYGAFVKLHPGSTGRLSFQGKEFRAVVVQGSLNVSKKNEKNQVLLKPGSYFGNSHPDNIEYSISRKTTVLYIHTNGPIQLHQNH